MTNDDAFGLDAAYALETPDDNRKLYAGWARTYESGFMADHSYVYHHHVAEIFDRHGGASGAETSVLDVGCGTGAVGTELAFLGHQPIDGIDISPEMLEVAATKVLPDDSPAYRQLVEADLTATIDLPDRSYGGIVSAGTFTFGHLGPESLTELLRVGAPGCRYAVGVNAIHYREQTFDEWLENACADGAITKPVLVDVAVYEGDHEHAQDRALVVVFERI
ncbi:MAG: class I SAM-dependent DNA methyltransferase [Acidimicrobiales bacterium]|jgi:ubiquinone/menaquinone biosynthesis C-methylase UbiE